MNPRRLAALKAVLDRAYAEYDARWIEPDPVQFVWRYDRPEDREVAGLISSSLAYGTVKQIKKSVERVLAILGPRPAQTIDHLDADFFLVLVHQHLRVIGGRKSPCPGCSCRGRHDRARR